MPLHSFLNPQSGLQSGLHCKVKINFLKCKKMNKKNERYQIAQSGTRGTVPVVQNLGFVNIVGGLALSVMGSVEK